MVLPDERSHGLQRYVKSGTRREKNKTCFLRIRVEELRHCPQKRVNQNCHLLSLHASFTIRCALYTSLIKIDEM